MAGPDGYRSAHGTPTSAADFPAVLDLLRGQVDHGYLTTAGLADAVRVLQSFLFAKAVPDDALAECRGFVGHCNVELVARQRDGS